MFINEYDEVPYEAISYLTGECNYGGRVTDDWDRRTLLTMLGDFYNPNVVSEAKYKFSPSGIYYAPPKSSYEDYLKFIKDLPQAQQPEVFGMHDNVDISRELQETKQLFDNVLLTMGRGEGGASSKADDTLFHIANDILNKVNCGSY